MTMAAVIAVNGVGRRRPSLKPTGMATRDHTDESGDSSGHIAKAGDPEAPPEPAMIARATTPKNDDGR